jgi:hypothetical protein
MVRVIADVRRHVAHVKGFAEFMTRKCRPSQCASIASTSFYCGVGRLITMEK